MSKYMTSQRKVITDYLSRHPDELLSATQIAMALRNNGISKSAVYRNISELECTGQLVRVTQKGRREALYRYTGAEHCRESLHLNCKMCGKTYHMRSENAELLINKLAIDGFAVDRSQTVIYGICADCRKG